MDFWKKNRRRVRPEPLDWTPERSTPNILDCGRVMWPELHKQILELVREYYQQRHRAAPFQPGTSPVPYGGRVFDEEEMIAGVDALLDFWLTLGPEGDAFEAELSRYIGVRHALLVNSGSSANLLAFATLTSPDFKERLRPGDEVLTVATGFPTTVAPILQYGCVPVFLDVDLQTANVRVEDLEDAVSPRTRAIVLAHTLGNPFDLGAVMDLARRHNLLLIEDNCDALGATYGGAMTGTFGCMATQSFYPPHHMTMGEGGAILTSSSRLRRIAASFRDWGRDCWCPAGKDDTCGRRFGQKAGELPVGYDHKYIYRHLGYNLKPLDIQAAIGRRQLKKIDDFVRARRANHALLRKLLAPLEEYFHFPEPTRGSEPSWFGFMLTIRDGVPFNRRELVRHLESRQIQTRLLFGGNLLKQPAFAGAPHRAVGSLATSDKIMRDAFFLGVYPGLTGEMLEYVAEVMTEFVAGVKRHRRAA
jgi:CDP-6-deoxy-D-xylo-4-hexulose-3-dehydrase